jgi:lipopolysaccharide transport system permease protein
MGQPRLTFRSMTSAKMPDTPAAPDREPWSLVIRPRRGWFEFNLDELWRYRDLIVLFVWRDFVAQYKQTILGPLWYIIQPLLMSLTFTVVFGRLAGMSTDGVNDFLFYMAGTVVWSYFAACLTKTANTFTGNVAIFGKVYFPRLIVPVSVLISNLIAFALQLALFFAFLIYFVASGAEVRPNAWLLSLPLLVLLMAALGLGIGIIVSSLTTRYRDLQFLVTFGTQLLMFATPVIYPLSSVPDKYRWLAVANPMTPVIETFRYAFLGNGTFDLTHLAYSGGAAAFVLLVGILIFNRVEQTFMDTV